MDILFSICLIQLYRSSLDFAQIILQSGINEVNLQNLDIHVQLIFLFRIKYITNGTDQHYKILNRHFISRSRNTNIVMHYRK